jgi:serine phosphatase RsbU (regulator of sigma subunit)
VTLFHARLVVGRREIRYVDAGHGHSFVRRAHGAIERLARGGRPIGFPAAAPYREATLRLHPEDILLVYSDGLAEGAGPADLLEKVDTEAAASEIVDQVIERAPRSTTADDVTVLVLKCTSDDGASGTTSSAA